MAVAWCARRLLPARIWQRQAVSGMLLPDGYSRHTAMGTRSWSSSSNSNSNSSNHHRVAMPAPQLRRWHPHTQCGSARQRWYHVGGSGSEDTVFALSTAPGRAGVAVIRVSGPAAASAVHQVAQPLPAQATAALPPARMATMCRVVHPGTGEDLDDALMLWFPGPKSFTGEDVLELHVHGSRAVVNDVLSALGSLKSFRAAEPGEFTKRALLNRKMDLTEVEGLADLLNADTEAQRRQALKQMRGAMSATYNHWRREIVSCLAHVEAYIDFAEDELDVTDEVFDAVAPRARALLEDMQRHLNDGHRGEIIRDGVRLAIVGPPNAGKSSLLNELAQRPAAIVSPVPGTTRDVIEVSLDLGGYAVTVADTAGIRDTGDAIEQEGVSRARAERARADLVVLVLDVQDVPGCLDHDTLALLNESAALVLNKVDTLSAEALDAAQSAAAAVHPRALTWCISCTKAQGIDDLVAGISDAVFKRLHHGEQNNDEVITRARHRQHVAECVEQLQAYLRPGVQIDIAAEELRLAVACLGRITGRVDVEDLLDVVFADFCIGK